MDKCISEYTEFIESNLDEIVAYINNQFDNTKDFIRAKIIHRIKDYLTPVPEHYILKYNGCGYDHSGELFQEGKISLKQTVREFLENEYNGNKEATYVSGMGWNYLTYEDSLQYETIEIATNIMYPAIKRFIENSLHINLTEEQFDAIKGECGEFDEIYDNCLASDFFFVYPAIEFVNIGNMTLNEIIKKG